MAAQSDQEQKAKTKKKKKANKKTYEADDYGLPPGYDLIRSKKAGTAEPAPYVEEPDYSASAWGSDRWGADAWAPQWQADPWAGWDSPAANWDGPWQSWR
eukprot:5029896-Alexandrium_andersonii.AAC.1